MAYRGDVALHQHKAKVYPKIAKILKNRQVKRFLTLPSDTAGEIEFLFNKGIITKDTEIVGFEIDKEKAINAKAFLYQMGIKNVRIFIGRIEDNVDFIKKEHFSSPFDFIFFDYCGNYNRRIADFTRDISCVINSTFCAFTLNLLYRTGRDFIQENADLIDTPMTSYEVHGIDIEDTQISQRYTKEFSTREIAQWSCAMISESIQNYSLSSITIYREKGIGCHPMLFVISKPNAKAAKLSFSTAHSMSNNHSSFSEDSMQFNTLTAGKKAAITRKINQLEANYLSQTSAGKKAAIRKQINKIKAEYSIEK